MVFVFRLAAILTEELNIQYFSIIEPTATFHASDVSTLGQEKKMFVCPFMKKIRRVGRSIFFFF